MSPFRRLFPTFAVAAALFAWSAPGGAQTLARTAPPEVDDALKSRVARFYSHFQKGEFRQAEDMVDEASRELFYNAKKTRILDYAIGAVKYAEDFRAANVLVVCKAILTFSGTTPVDMPLSSDWRFQDGDWWLHLSERARPEGADAGSPFGAMSFSQQMAAPGSMMTPQASAAPPTIESLSKMYKVSAESLAFSIAAEEPVTQTVEVKNMAAGRLSLERSSGPIAGIEVAIEPASIEPGQDGKIHVTYDPKKAVHGAGRLRLDFTVMPIAQAFELYLDF